MGRVKDCKNKLNTSESGRPFTSTLPLEERIKILANLFVDRIVEDYKYNNLPITSIKHNE